MVVESGVGHRYRTVNEAAQTVKNVLESNQTRDSPAHIAERVGVFSSESFHEKIAKLVTGGPGEENTQFTRQCFGRLDKTNDC